MMSHMQRELMDSAPVQRGTSGVKSDTAVYTADGCSLVQRSPMLQRNCRSHTDHCQARGDLLRSHERVRRQLEGRIHFEERDVGRGRRPVRGRESIRAQLQGVFSSPVVIISVVRELRKEKGRWGSVPPSGYWCGYALRLPKCVCRNLLLDLQRSNWRLKIRCPLQ